MRSTPGPSVEMNASTPLRMASAVNRRSTALRVPLSAWSFGNHVALGVRAHALEAEFFEAALQVIGAGMLFERRRGDFADANHLVVGFIVARVNEAEGLPHLRRVEQSMRLRIADCGCFDC